MTLPVVPLNDDATATETDMLESQLRQLYEWAATLRLEDIPEPVLCRAAEILFDDFSAMTAAWREPEFRRLYEQFDLESKTPESSVICRPGIKTDRTSAALVNAISANWLELDEGYRKTPCHAGLYTLPALLALAEADNTPTDQLLRNLIAAYELITRIARAFPQKAVVMQSHGRFAALGAAFATALHHGSDAAQLADAASAAVTLITPSPRNHLAGGALVRNVWAGVGARSGMEAFAWSKAGITGMPSSVLDVYTTVLGGDFKPQALADGLGQDWAVSGGYTKIYACCQHLHAAVEAALEIREDVQRKGLENIDSIHVETHHLALPLDQAHPKTSLAAKFSMSHAMSAVLTIGEAGESAFSSDIIHDGRINALRQRVSMTPWPGEVPAPPNDRPALVHVRFKDGTALLRECLSARGGSDRPHTQASLLAKIERLAAETYPGISTVAAALTSTTQGDLWKTPWRELLTAMRQS